MKLVKAILASAVVCLFASPCYATCHVFIVAKDGSIWIGSDTLEQDLYDGHVVSNLTKCKVVIQRGRIIFNAGWFTDTTLLRSAEANLPGTKAMTTAQSLEHLLAQYHWEPAGTAIDPHFFAQHSGVIQVDHGVYSAALCSLSTNHNNGFHQPIYLTIAGIPHGYGDSVDEAKAKAAKDFTFRRWVSEHPKVEILTILKKESILHHDTVGEPYTIFVLHKNGTVSDYSQKHVCEIPPDARYRRNQSSLHHTK